MLATHNYPVSKGIEDKATACLNRGGEIQDEQSIGIKEYIQGEKICVYC